MMRFKSVSIVALLLLVAPALAQEDVNRHVVVGVVYHSEPQKTCKDTKVPIPFGKGEATAEIYKQDTYNDPTNEEGVFGFFIPKEYPKFQLVIRARGFKSMILDPVPNTRPVHKFGKICLEERPDRHVYSLTGMNADFLASVEAFLNVEKTIALNSTSLATKSAARINVTDFLQSIQRMPVNNPVESRKLLSARQKAETALATIDQSMQQ